MYLHRRNALHDSGLGDARVEAEVAGAKHNKYIAQVMIVVLTVLSAPLEAQNSRIFLS
jgi:hypothetical protein